MPTTLDDFRSIALSFPETVESAHMSHPDFRVKGKIFATIWPDENWGMVKLSPEQQDIFVQSDPAVFAPVKGGWGRMGATNIRLKAASKTKLRHALLAAWRKTAPKALVAEFDK